MYLITNALESTWPSDRPALLLGEWCRRFSNKSTWSVLHFTNNTYHWNDRQKLRSDYLYIASLYEDLLGELTARLNEVHKTNHSIRYWRILVGPWLGHFVQVLFDRWCVLERALEDFKITQVNVLKLNPDTLIPSEMSEFIANYVGDAWNEGIFGQLLERYTTIAIERIQSKSIQRDAGKLKSHISSRTVATKCVKKSFHLLMKWATRRDEAFLMATYMPRKYDLLLQCRLAQVPKIWRSAPVPRVSVNWSMRQWTMGVTGIQERCKFDAIVRDLIPFHLPTDYLEGFADLKSVCAQLPWPSQPSVIFTSNSFSSDDVFKAWAADKVEKGATLVIGQHGGNYGMALWSYMEEHQIAIADKYLSWGWSRQSEPKVEPVCNLKVMGQSQDWDPSGGALMIELTLPRYSYQMFSSPVACQWLNYFDDQCRFVRALPERIRKQLTVRLYSDYGWDEAERWRDQFPDIQLDPGMKPLPSLIARSRISISTYNATTFLESLALNVPTIVFWDPVYWELNEAASREMQVLKDAGIFHDNPESAAAQLAQVWDDVPGWWRGASVQQAREKFCATYSRTSKDSLKQLEGALRRAMRTKSKTENHE